MIESVRLESWAPDTDENNPALIAASQSVIPVNRGGRTLIATRGSPGVALETTSDITNTLLDSTPKRWMPAPVNAYTAYWSDGSSTQFVLIGKLPSQTCDDLGMPDSGDFNGAIVVPEKQGVAMAIKAHTTTARSNHATTPANWPSTFSLDFDYYGSFAQYGDYCFIATGDFLTYIPKGGTPVAFGDRTQSSGSIPYTPDAPGGSDNSAFKPRFVAQAGDRLFAACVVGTTPDSATVTMDEVYWIASNVNVLSSGFPKFSFTDDSTVTSDRVADTPGPITGMRSLDRSVVIYKRNSVYLLADDGSGITQQVLSREVGPTGDQSVVDLGGKHVFMGRNDIYYIEGQTVQTLPNGCREFLFGPDGDIDKERIHGVRGQFDRKNNCVYWYYPSREYAEWQTNSRRPVAGVAADDGKPVCDSWVCWNIVLNSWTNGRFRYFRSPSVATDSPWLGYGQGVTAVCQPDVDLSSALNYLQFGTTTNPFFSGTPNWNTVLTDALWGDSAFSSVADRTAAVFSGVIQINQGVKQITVGVMRVPKTGKGLLPIRAEVDLDLFQNSLRYVHEPSTANEYLTAKVRTGDFGDGVSYKFVRGVRPRFVGSYMPTKVTCRVYVRQHLSEDWRNTDTTTVTTSPSGAVEDYMTTGAPYWFHIRSNSRYHQFEFEYDGRVELSGYDIDYDDAGTR